MERRLAMELNPLHLQKSGLLPALEWLAGHIHDIHKLKVDTDFDRAVEPRDEGTRAFVFQAVRELLFNVVKHAGADSARLKALYDSEAAALVVIVSDSGTGFDPASLSELDSSSDEPGMGLISICNRLEALGGQLEIYSRPGEGARLNLMVPLQKEGQDGRQTE